MEDITYHSYTQEGTLKQSRKLQANLKSVCGIKNLQTTNPHAMKQIWPGQKDNMVSESNGAQ